MFHLITGGSGSGKSEYAEHMISRYWKQEKKGKLIYIATMFPDGDETAAKIERHKQMRAGKSFETIECYTDLSHSARELAEQYPDSSVLLECISNLTANELYMDEGAGANTASVIIEGIAALCRLCQNVVVVTNELNSDVLDHNIEMKQYCQVVGEINCRLGQAADRVTEVIYGIPVEVKE